MGACVHRPIGTFPPTPFGVIEVWILARPNAREENTIGTVVSSGDYAYSDGGGPQIRMETSASDNDLSAICLSVHSSASATE